MNPDLIGWIGNVFFILGAILLAKKYKFGFSCNIIGNICYIYQGISVSTRSLWVLSIGLVLINAYGIYNWRKNK